MSSNSVRLEEQPRLIEHEPEIRDLCCPQTH